MGLRRPLEIFYSFRIDFRRQNLTSLDVRFWRVKSYPRTGRANIVGTLWPTVGTKTFNTTWTTNVKRGHAPCFRQMSEIDLPGNAQKLAGCRVHVGPASLTLAQHIAHVLSVGHSWCGHCSDSIQGLCWVLIPTLHHAVNWVSEYFSTSLSAHHGNIAKEESPKPGLCSTLTSNDFKVFSLSTLSTIFFIVYNTIGNTVHSMPLNSLEHGICTATMTNIRPDRDSNLVRPGYKAQSMRMSHRIRPRQQGMFTEWCQIEHHNFFFHRIIHV